MADQHPVTGAVDGATSRPIVLFITRKWGPRVGGMETWSQSLAARLASRLPVEVMCLPSRDHEQGPRVSSMLAFGVRVVRRILARALPDVVHVGDLALWPLAALASTRRPTFITVHGSDAAFADVASAAGRAYRLYLSCAAPVLGSVGLLPNSRATADKLEALGLDPEPPMILGVDAAESESGSPGAGVQRSRVLFVGRLMERKGLSWFVEHVLGELPATMELWVAGARWDAGEEQALDHPRVEFLGPKSPVDLRELRRTSVAVVVPNRASVSSGSTAFEGFGLVAVEAAADGGVVLASDLHGLRDAVVDGATGFLLAPDDPDAWVDKLVGVQGWSRAERAEFVRRAMSIVAERYSWDRYLDELLATYRRACSGGSGQAGERAV